MAAARIAAVAPVIQPAVVGSAAVARWKLVQAPPVSQEAARTAMVERVLPVLAE